MNIKRQQYLRKLQKKLVAIKDNTEFLSSVNNLSRNDVADLPFVDCKSDDDLLKTPFAKRWLGIERNKRKQLIRKLNKSNG